MLRAKETADVLHESQPQAKRIVLEGFRSMNFGDFHGKPYKRRDRDDNDNNGNKNNNNKSSDVEEREIERFQYYNNLQMKDKSFRMPGEGGESLGQLEERALEALHRIVEDNPDAKYIAIVAHGRVNGVLMASLLNHDARQCHNYLQQNCTVTCCDWNEVDGHAELVS